MKYGRFISAVGVAAIGLLLLGAGHVSAHCDGEDGPVVKAAQKALATNNVKHALIWVQKENDGELQAVFEQTMAVRQLGPNARALADRNFYETLVRLHRQGEGAPYTGLKPAGRDLGPAIPAADRAIESGGTQALEALLVRSLRMGLRDAFAKVQARKNFDPSDVAAGREYVQAYVEYIHFVERLHEATAAPAAGHFGQTTSR